MKMKSILLVPGTRRSRDALLGAVAAVRAGERASLHMVQLSGPGAAGDAHACEPRPASVDVVASRQPAEILARARAVHADLVVLAPELPPDRGPLWLDPLVVRVAAGAEQAVLVLRDPGHWPPRKVLLPLVEADAAAATFTRAARWLDTLFGPPEGENDARGPELHVLRVAADMERWYEMNDSLRVEARELRYGVPARMRDCMRFGTEPGRRILRWIDQESPDLLVLGRPLPAGGARPETGQAWLRVLCGTRGSVLLLPPRPAPVGPPRRDDASLWRWVSGVWPRGGTRDLPPSA
jgi:hypothetical protein